MARHCLLRLCAEINLRKNIYVYSTTHCSVDLCLTRLPQCNAFQLLGLIFPGGPIRQTKIIVFPVHRPGELKSANWVSLFLYYHDYSFFSVLFVSFLYTGKISIKIRFSDRPTSCQSASAFFLGCIF